MATFDELRLQELLSPFNNQGNNTGITSINQDYTDPRYTYDGLYQENYGDYDERMNPDRYPYGYVYGTNSAQASQSSAFPLTEFGNESAFAPRIGLPNQVPQNLAFLPNQVPQINNQTTGTADTAPFFFPQINNQVPQINNQVPLNFDTSYGVANEEDEEQVDYLPGQKKKLSDMGRNFGISSLIGMITGNPIIGLLSRGAKGIGEGLSGLNNRMQNSDFGRSKTLVDYLDARKYGGIDARDRAAQQNMREARAIQTQVDRRGDSTSRVADRNRSSVTRSSAAKSKGVGGGGYTKSDSNRESYRG